LGVPHEGTRHFRSATLGGGGRLGLPSCWQGQRGASYCRLCRAKTVRRCFTRLEYKFCLRLYFVNAKILSTHIFCRCQYFVDAYILLTSIFCRCTFCVKSKSWVPHRENFTHIFFDCQYINGTVLDFASAMLKRENNLEKSRLGCLTGIYETTPSADSFFYVLTSIFCNFTIWQCKQKKIVPSLATLLNEVDSHFLYTASVSTKISEMAKTSNTPVCRRWRAHGHGRG
jgi:hypothetical protein